MTPRQTGSIQVESGRVRSGNHRAPPAARSDCRSAENQQIQSAMWPNPCPGLVLVWSVCELTSLVQAQVSESQREADPHGQLDPDQHAGLEGVAVVSDVELRNDTTQVLLELEPECSDHSSRLLFVQLWSVSPVTRYNLKFVSHRHCCSVQPFCFARTETSYRSLWARSAISACSASTCTSPVGYFGYRP